MTRRLYLQIYAAFLGIGLLCVVAVGVLAAIHERDVPDVLSSAVGLALDASSPRGLAGRVQDVSRQLGVDVTVRAGDGRVVATAGTPIADGEQGWFHDRDRNGVRMTLVDGRRVAMASVHVPRRPGAHLAVIAVVAVVVALGSLPLARRITRRLEAVQGAVARWGEGDLQARVPVEGRDEVAAVAATFNAAADRVQALVEAQRRTLASASHELRSPLARVRMALALLDDDDPERRALIADAVRDVEELDLTVGDLLRVGRLQAVGLEVREPVDVRALLGEEAAHTGAAVTGPPLVVSGDPRLLRRLVRNLLENAARHGAPPIEASTTTDRRLLVEDRGAGIPASEAGRVFEPFHRPAGHDEGRGGVGLGLWLVREIADRHGTTVGHRPREGGGTTFEVRFPA